MEDSKTIIHLLTDLLGRRAIRVGTLHHGRGLSVREVAKRLNISRVAVKNDLRAIARIALTARQASRRDSRQEVVASLN